MVAFKKWKSRLKISTVKPIITPIWLCVCALKIHQRFCKITLFSLGVKRRRRRDLDNKIMRLTSLFLKKCRLSFYFSATGGFLWNGSLYCQRLLVISSFKISLRPCKVRAARRAHTRTRTHTRWASADARVAHQRRPPLQTHRRRSLQSKLKRVWFLLMDTKKWASCVRKRNRCCR